ncbi:MAG: protein kinase [Deltaproteobacteria bacterium]|nr:protein kinase [Deltaproteobacteria bacterium]
MAPETWGAIDVGAVLGGKYRVERVLGRGGMGVVFEATHVHLGQRVAIKLLTAEAASFPGAAARFLREARAATRLRSDRVVRVLDVDTLEGGTPYMVMELLDGVDLHALVRARGPLPLAEVVEYVLQACEPLAEAHALGIIHRDLKPANLFLTRAPDGRALVKLLDFGIAKAPDAQPWTEGSLTATRATLGSPVYMSPEHLRDSAHVDTRADIWSMGVILYELATARHPFEAGSPAALGARIASDAPTSPRAHRPDLPEAFEHVVLRCLEKSPDGRFASVDELIAALRPFAGHAAITVERPLASAVGGSDATVLASSAGLARPPPAPTSSRSPTDNFRRQHEELARLGAEIIAALETDVAAHAAHVRRLVARFAGKLSMHATMENEALYPRLLAHRDASVSGRAKALYDEVSTLYASFGTYAKRWPDSASIEADPAAFTKDTRRVLAILSARMRRENDELYPLVDRAGD